MVEVTDTCKCMARYRSAYTCMFMNLWTACTCVQILLFKSIERERFCSAELRVMGDEVDGVGHSVLGKDGLQVLCR